MIARGDKEEGILRFGREGYERINREINRDILMWILCVAIPFGLIITFAVYLVFMGTPIR